MFSKPCNKKRVASVDGDDNTADTKEDYVAAQKRAASKQKAKKRAASAMKISSDFSTDDDTVLCSLKSPSSKKIMKKRNSILTDCSDETPKSRQRLAPKKQRKSAVSHNEQQRGNADDTIEDHNAILKKWHSTKKAFQKKGNEHPIAQADDDGRHKNAISSK